MSREKESIVIHSYLPVCQTNPQPPGFADFLRGSITLYKYSKKYGFTLYFDKDIHPIFNYLKSSPYFISDQFNMEVIELLPPKKYSTIDENLQNLFETKKSFSVMTNALYSKDNDGNLVNFGEIDSTCKAFFKNILKPNLLLENKLFIVFDRYYNIESTDDYKVIHLRLGDHYIYNQDHFDNSEILLLLKNKIFTLMNLEKNLNSKFLLITDCDPIGNALKELYPNLGYWSNIKNHLGNFKKISCEISDTLVDFFILSRAKEIINYSIYSWATGFSTINSLIFDIQLSNLMDY
jgi:hypothetical protein